MTSVKVNFVDKKVKLASVLVTQTNDCTHDTTLWLLIMMRVEKG